MPVTERNVVETYQVVLARPPEAAEVERALSTYEFPSDLTNALLQGREFSRWRSRRRRRHAPVTPDLVAAAYRVLLAREPESRRAVDDRVRNCPSHAVLVRGLASSKERSGKLERERVDRTTWLATSPKVVFLHIPKTAGMSFARFARDVYEDAVCISTDGSIDHDRWATARIVGGHFHRTRYDGLARPRLFIGVVRDPVDRAISRFNYYRDTEFAPHRVDHAAERRFDRDDLARTIHESTMRGEFVNDLQCRYLSGRPEFSAVRDAFAADAYVIGTFDQIGDWINQLAELLAWPQVELPRVNTASDPALADELRRDDDLVSLLRDLNREDQALYDFVAEHGVYASKPGFDYSPFAP